MNKLIFTMLLACCSITSFAKDGFYKGASLGFGRAQQNLKEPGGFSTGDAFSRYEPTPAWQVALSAGYQLRNWRIAADIQYLADGFDTRVTTLRGEVTQYHNRFGHVNIPLRVGYNIGLSRKLAVVPYAGISAGYNFNPVTRWVANGDRKSDRSSAADFEWAGYRHVSVMAIGQVDVRYQVCDMMAITLGPRYSYQVGSLRKFDLNKAHIEPVKLNSLLVNLGIELTAPSSHHRMANDREKAENVQ